MSTSKTKKGTNKKELGKSKFYSKLSSKHLLEKLLKKREGVGKVKKSKKKRSNESYINHLSNKSVGNREDLSKICLNLS